MRTYIKSASGNIGAVHASRKEVLALPEVQCRHTTIIKATKALRDAAKHNITIKNLRILESGGLGYL